MQLINCNNYTHPWGIFFCSFHGHEITIWTILLHRKRKERKENDNKWCEQVLLDFFNGLIYIWWSILIYLKTEEKTVRDAGVLATSVWSNASIGLRKEREQSIKKKKKKKKGAIDTVVFIMCPNRTVGPFLSQTSNTPHRYAREQVRRTGVQGLLFFTIKKSHSHYPLQFIIQL